jgi:nucleoside 2-deoxyribosyltransferase
MKVYLAGPIFQCTDAEASDWRKDVELKLGPAFICLDPMARDYRGREAECVKEIVEGDKADIDAADVLLVNHVKPSVGTSMEILYAFERGKPVVIVAALPASPWLHYHARALVPTIDEAVAFVHGLNRL